MKNTPVKVYENNVTYPTYSVGEADKNPMFFEKRVYQASSGKVYPLPFTDSVSKTKEDKEYIGLHLENEFLSVLVLPELGGRIQRALDKTNNYDFIYHNEVIKPALVGLAGPWISGGIEFNWPQHHRPTTFMAVDYSIEEHDDGAKTIWVGEIEPMGRTKVLTGITLRPGYSYIEISSKYFNRTPFMYNFLWWANPAVAVNDDYQSFFPQDVEWVADHGKRDVSTFPLAQGTYYDIDYSQRTDGSNDISCFRNIPVPTSYMALGSKFDFFGGYDHGRKAGLLHFASHHISPGKKQWTWGDDKFGQAWDRNLTDENGPYIELMAGVFTDNQPDFTWIAPFETKIFKQYFFPFKEIGLPKNANPEGAINLEISAQSAKVSVYSTHDCKAAKITLSLSGSSQAESVLAEYEQDLNPNKVFSADITLPQGFSEHELTLTFSNNKGKTLVTYTPVQIKESSDLKPATAAEKPQDIASNEELFLNGLHLEQYRHATRQPEPYYQEALSRDAGDSRCNNAMGSLLMRRGQLETALPYFDKAIERITLRNPNPYDGEAYYNRGICLKQLQRDEEAYDSLHKSLWNVAWAGPANYSLAELACKKADFVDAIEKLDEALRHNAFNTRATALKITVLRKLNKYDEARALAEKARKADPLCQLPYFELSCLDDSGDSSDSKDEFIKASRQNYATLLELAAHYAAAGFYQEAIELCAYSNKDYPMLSYVTGLYQLRSGVEPVAFEKAATLNSDYCFPSSLEEMSALQAAIEVNPADGMAHYYLANLFYDKRQHSQAIYHWEQAAKFTPEFATIFRNLGLAYFNNLNDAEKALAAYAKAFELNPNDGRVLFEFDQLRKKLNHPLRERLDFIEKHAALIQQRDDLTVEWMTLKNLLAEYKEVLEVLEHRWFTPWEGGEGKVVMQYETAHIALGHQALESEQYQLALTHFQACKDYPDNLGEGKMVTTPENNIDYFIGLAQEAAGNTEQAELAFNRAAAKQLCSTDMLYFEALACRKLNKESEALFAISRIEAVSADAATREPEIDYFAISLPDFLVFDNDLTLSNKIESLYFSALAKVLSGELSVAESSLENIIQLEPSWQKAHNLKLTFTQEVLLEV